MLSSENNSMQKFSHKYFEPGVFAFNAAHVVTALLFGMHIGHVIKLHYTAQTYKRLQLSLVKS